MAINSRPAAEAGDFEQLFERYYRPVNYYFAQRGCSHQTCQDLTQETFLGVYRGMGRYRQDAAIETWLYIIAANIWRNWLRSRSAQKRDAQEVSLEKMSEDGKETTVSSHPESDPLQHVLIGEEWAQLRKELEELCAPIISSMYQGQGEGEGGAGFPPPPDGSTGETTVEEVD